MIDYSLILNKKYAGSEWSLNGENYDGLEWFSDSPKPTKKELDSQWNEVQSLIAAESQAKAQAKADLLQRLGITADEAQLLLS
jgi:hypothetical protein